MMRRTIGLGVVIGFVAMAEPARAGDLSQPGVYHAGFRTVTVVRDPGLGTGTFTAMLYYPATSAGVDAPFDASGGVYPAVSFGHGFFQATTQYDDPMAHLATHGYFVIASNSETGLFPSHQQLANDMRSCLSWLEQQNADAGSPYFGHIDTQAMGMSGHSMGGGCSIVASAADARVRALVPLAPAETSVSAIGASATLGCPVLMICGTQDSIVPTASNGQLMYNAAPRARQLVSITGGFHCGFTDASTIGCDSGGITRGAQQAITRRLMVEWFNLYLKGSDDWRPVWGPESASTPGVQRAAEARFAITPATQTVKGSTTTLHAPITLASAMPALMEYRFAAVDQDRATVVSPGETPAVAKGGTFNAAVQWQSPKTALTDELMVSAFPPRSGGGDGGTRAWSRVTFVFTPSKGCPADANADGVVNAADLSVLLSNFGGAVSGAGAGDLNSDGRCDGADLSVLLGAFGTTCS